MDKPSELGHRQHLSSFARTVPTTVCCRQGTDRFGPALVYRTPTRAPQDLRRLFPALSCPIVTPAPGHPRLSLALEVHWTVRFPLAQPTVGGATLAATQWHRLGVD
jgi:hypothetical protein